MKSETIQLYPDRSDVTLRAYLLGDSPELTGDKKRPAVMVLPGGAYCWCSEREGEPIAMAFAAMGYHAFILNYSVYFGGGKIEFDAAKMKPKPEVVYPAGLRDIGKAMLCIREHGDEWHVDPDKIILSGCSGGAHLSALYATSWYKPVLTDFFKVNADNLRPAAAIICYGPSDYVTVYRDLKKLNNPQLNNLFSMVSISLMGTPEPKDALLEEISPAWQVNKKTPPMFLWATSEDELVSSEQTLLLGAALARNNIPYELHIFETGSHGLSLAQQASAGFKNQLNSDVAKWIDLADSWLQKRFGLDIPDVLVIPDWANV
jgi:acetyl esterase/lipase